MAKDEESDSSRKFVTRSVDVDASEDKEASLCRSPSKSIPFVAPTKMDSKVNVAGKKSSSNRLNQADRSVILVSDTQKIATPKLTESLTSHQVRGSEKPLIQPMMIKADKTSLTLMPVIQDP